MIIEAYINPKGKLRTPLQRKAFYLSYYTTMLIIVSSITLTAYHLYTLL